MRWLSAVSFLLVVGCGGAGAGAGPGSAGGAAPDGESADATDSASDPIYDQLVKCSALTSNSGIALKCDGFAIQLGRVEVKGAITEQVLRETESIAIGGVEESWGIPVQRVPVDLGGVPATGFPPPDERHPGGLAVSTAVSESQLLITMCVGPPCPRLMGDAEPFFRAVRRFLEAHPPEPAS